MWRSGRPVRGRARPRAAFVAMLGAMLLAGSGCPEQIDPIAESQPGTPSTGPPPSTPPDPAVRIAEGLGGFVVWTFDAAVGYAIQSPIVSQRSRVGLGLYESDRSVSTGGVDPNPRDLSASGATARTYGIAADGPWLVFRRPNGTTPEGDLMVYDRRLPFSATNPTKWEPAIPSTFERVQADLADGWLVLSGHHVTTGLPAVLYGFDLDDGLAVDPVLELSDVSTALGSIDVSPAGLLWQGADDVSVRFLAPPFDPADVVDLGTGTRLVLHGPYAAFLDAGQLVVFDATRPLASGQNPRSLGAASSPPSLSADGGIAWLYDHQVFTADLSSVAPQSVQRSDSAFDHAQPRVVGDGVAWLRCTDGKASETCWSGAFRGLAYYSPATGSTPIVFHDGVETVQAAVGSPLGVAWSAGPAFDESVYFFDPVRAVVPGQNPVKASRDGLRSHSPLLTSDALYWYAPFDAHALYAIEAQTLLGLTTPAP